MRYLYAAAAVFILGCVSGGYLMRRLQPGPVVREVPKLVTKVETVTKETIKQADGTVIERVVTQTKDQVKTSPQPPKPQYRVGALLPIASELRLPTVSASRRLFGGVWLDSQFDLRHKEITVGVSVEF
jgi:hypothetical protein